MTPAERYAEFVTAKDLRRAEISLRMAVDWARRRETWWDDFLRLGR